MPDERPPYDDARRQYYQAQFGKPMLKKWLRQFALDIFFDLNDVAKERDRLRNENEALRAEVERLQATEEEAK